MSMTIQEQGQPLNIANDLKRIADALDKLVEFQRTLLYMAEQMHKPKEQCDVCNKPNERINA